ncbi:MAG: hypothetical protein R2853_08585 [Thermomicrobiales bacterium]
MRPTGQPHVTPLVDIWPDGVTRFTPGAEEHKAISLSANPASTLTAGCNDLN